MHLRPMPTPRALLLLAAATTASALRVAPSVASGFACASPSRSLCVRMEADDGEAAGGGGDIDAFRAQLMRQFSGASVEREISSVREATSLAPGQILVANPARFCSRNPFSRAVQDLERFGLSGPVSDDNMPPDMRASMLPVLALIEHGGSMPSSSAGGKSRALLLERRSGALMGDISMDECVPRNSPRNSPPRNSSAILGGAQSVASDGPHNSLTLSALRRYGCVAISPLWLGGLAQQQQLCVVHDVPDLEGATAVCDGMWLGGWRAAQPKVSDRTLAEGRFKFFLGCTEWKAGQLRQEVRDTRPPPPPPHPLARLASCRRR